MAITTLYPTANGTDTDWTLGAGPTKYEAVQSNDGDTTFNRINSSLVKNDTFVMQALGLTGVEVVKIRVRGYARINSGTGYLQLRIRSGANTSNSSQQTVSSSYTLMSAIWTTNPWTAANWRIDEIDNILEAGYASETGHGNQRLRETQVYLDIQWNYRTGKLVNGGVTNAGLIGGRIVS